MPSVDVAVLAQELIKLTAVVGSFQIAWADGKFVVQVFDGPIATKSGTGTNPRFSVAYQVAVNKFMEGK